MSRAQEQLRALQQWIDSASTSYRTTLGNYTVERGPYAVVLPQSLDLPPAASCPSESLPLWVPEQQEIPGLPPFALEPPMSQGYVSSRLRHIVWMFMQGRFKGALIALEDPEEPLQSALDRQLPSLELDEQLVLFLPVFLLTGEDRVWVGAQLPVLRQ